MRGVGSRLQAVKLRTQPALGKDRAFQKSDLFFEAAHHRQVGSQCAILVLELFQRIDISIFQLLDIVAFDRLC